MGKNASSRQSVLCTGLPPSAPIVEPTEEGENMGDKGESTAQSTAMIAHGVLRPLYDKRHCPTCARELRQEATYICGKCGGLFHIRCMATAHANPQSRQAIYSKNCFLCAVQGGNSNGMGGGSLRASSRMSWGFAPPALRVDARGGAHKCTGRAPIMAKARSVIPENFVGVCANSRQC